MRRCAAATWLRRRPAAAPKLVFHRDGSRAALSLWRFRDVPFRPCSLWPFRARRCFLVAQGGSRCLRMTQGDLRVQGDVRWLMVILGVSGRSSATLRSGSLLALAYVRGGARYPWLLAVPAWPLILPCGPLAIALPSACRVVPPLQLVLRRPGRPPRRAHIAQVAWRACFRSYPLPFQHLARATASRTPFVCFDLVVA